MSTSYLKLEEVIAIHDDQIERHGGSHGVRDLNLLMSATARPAATFGGKDLYPTTYLKAASLIHSLIFNHSFIDGNKRTAMVSGMRFMYINGLEINYNKKTLVEVALNIETKKWNIEKLANWLEENTNKISQ